MTTQLQLRRGTTADHATFTGAQGEVTLNTSTKRLHSHDGSTTGGSPHALMSDLSGFVTSSALSTTLSSYATTSSVYSVPSGGKAGQVLTKNSATDYDLTWTYPTKVSITSINSTSYTLALTDQYVRSTNTGSTTITIPANSAVAFPIGTQITIIQAAGTQLQIASVTNPVTLLYPDTLIFRKVGSSATLTKVGTDAWELAGDMKVS